MPVAEVFAAGAGLLDFGRPSLYGPPRDVLEHESHRSDRGHRTGGPRLLHRAAAADEAPRRGDGARDHAHRSCRLREDDARAPMARPPPARLVQGLSGRRRRCSACRRSRASLPARSSPMPAAAWASACAQRAHPNRTSSRSPSCWPRTWPTGPTTHGSRSTTTSSRRSRHSPRSSSSACSRCAR